MSFERTSSFILFIFITSISNLTLAQWNTKDYLKREHSLIKPYQGSGMTIPNWDFVGSTMVTTNYIRLTPDQQSKRGSLWNNVPCFVRNWELQVQFAVHGKGKELYGDGLAIWYAKDPLQLGRVFGSKEIFHGLGVFLDTYANQNGPHNHGHPYVSAMVNNGTLQYDHDRDGTHTEIAGCEAKFRGSDHDTHISIRYERDVLTISTDIEGKKAFKECFKVEGVRLPTGYYFGASAATGDLSDNHDIISMKLYELDLPGEVKEEEDRSKISPAASYFAPPRDHVEDPPPPMSGLKLLLIMVIAILGLVVCVVVGVVVFQRQQETSRKRFY
ncbi:vesicular integral-membrane protein VIP36-like [Centruroides sculpturatus]|uniref:vesicular integral-membrane protein VIP36-like n=1 Tax=Centruroides sculpturatus TaxID=218467 RepID=UPI000C6ED23C|nr:vesicular integral-membrane protein VIP36-like [Centruroides sculpturatus]